MKRILIIDDEVELVGQLTLRLEAAGYEILVAYDGQDGVAKAQAERPDLIVLDCMMPKMDGYQVCRLLKFDAAYKQIPIIMLTARSLEKDQLLGAKVGVDAYVAKPFDTATLLATIQTLLQSS